MLIKRDNIKFHIGIFFFIFGSFIFAQETYNLEIIWVKTTSPDGRYFGKSLSSGDLNGDSFSDIVIAGDSIYGGDTWTSKAYIFYGGSPFDTIPDLVITRPESIGFNKAICVKDINNDGFDDLVLGSQHINEVSIFLGGNPMDTICDYKIRGGSNFGCAVSSGDVNGDSFSDLIVGSYGYDNLKGRVYIYFGGPSFDTIPDVILDGGHNNDQESFGNTVGSSGDVNNDGFYDIIIGASTFGPNIQGRIYIYYGGNPMNTIYDVAMSGEVSNQSLGWTPTVNLLKTESGYSEAVFGTAFWPYGYPRRTPGKVYVLYGGNPMDSIPDVWMIGRTDSTGLGQRVSNAGFINQTNSEAIINGAPREYNDIGTAYLWLGGSDLDTIPDAWIRGEMGGDGIGWYVASAGDVNDDSIEEIMVSNYASTQTQKRVWICKYMEPGIEEERLTQNARRLTLEVKPNPAKFIVRVRCPLSAKEIRIYDIAGKVVKVLDEGKKLDSGEYELRWDLKDDSRKRVATGIYFIEINIEKELREIRKITVIK